MKYIETYILLCNNRNYCDVLLQKKNRNVGIQLMNTHVLNYSNGCVLNGFKELQIKNNNFDKI